jgi:hypothetical protein
MASAQAEYLNEIFRLLSEREELLKYLPYSSEQLKKGNRISARVRRLVDQAIRIEQSRAMYRV